MLFEVEDRVRTCAPPNSRTNRPFTVTHSHAASSPTTEAVLASIRASQGPGPLPESGLLALSSPLLAEPSGENETLIEDPSSENLALHRKGGFEAARKETTAPKDRSALEYIARLF